MPLRHLSSGETSRHGNFFKVIVWATVVFAIFFGVANFWQGKTALAGGHLLLVAIALGLRRAHRRGVPVKKTKWFLLLPILALLLWSLHESPYMSGYIWALLVPTLGQRLLGARTGSIVGAVFVLLAGLSLVTRFGTTPFIDNPRSVADIASFALVLLVASFFHERDLSDTDRRLRERADLDSLTRLATRPRFREMYEQVRHAARLDRTGAHQKVSMILIDLDNFKHVNDTYGHTAGDTVLGAVSKRLLNQCRAGDLLGRIGGEELAIMLFGLDHEAAVRKAERLRLCICATPIGTQVAQLPITASVGVTTRELASSNFETLFRETDIRLYAAKEAGRNRVQSEPVG